MKSILYLLILLSIETNAQVAQPELKWVKTLGVLS